jgi:hypothetical protein
MKPTLSNYRKTDIDELKRDVKQSQNIEKVLLAIAGGLIINAVAFPQQPKDQIIMSLGLSSVTSFIGAYWKKSKEELYNRFDSYMNLNREHYKYELTRDYAHEAEAIDLAYGNKRIISQVASQLELAGTLSGLPTQAQVRYSSEFGLQGLLLPQLESESGGHGSPGVNSGVYQVSLQNDLKAIEQKYEVDLTWIDTDFINASKIVVGAKKSGKSTYLRYEASRWLIENPEGVLIICDPHYDSSDPSKWWLNDLSQSDVESKFLVKKTSDIDKIVNDLSTELNCRIDGIKNGKTYNKYPKIKIVFDEEENHKNRSADFPKFIKFIDMVQNEGRKYLFEITIGMHSLKKENTGIDSATLSQMEWFLFEKACYDSATKFPDDFDKKTIKETARSLSLSLPKNIGRTVVILKQELTDPIITVLPLLHPPIITLASTSPPESVEEIEEDFWHDSGEIEEQPGDRYEVPPESSRDFRSYYESMVKWVRLCLDTYQRYPIAADIKTAWLQLTGQDLSEAALCLLIEKLFKDVQ